MQRTLRATATNKIAEAAELKEENLPGRAPRGCRGHQGIGQDVRRRGRAAQRVHCPAWQLEHGAAHGRRHGDGVMVVVGVSEE